MAKKKAAKKKAAKKAPKRKAIKKAAPVAGVIDNSFARDSSDALLGHFGRVTAGEYKGRYGVLETFAEYDAKGFPSRVNFRTRDDNSELLTVDYNAIEPAEAGGR